MSIEQAIHDRWEVYHPLVSVVPAERFVTGFLPPAEDEIYEHPVQGFPYVTLSRQGESQVERTSSGTMLVLTQYQFSVWGDTLDQAKQISDEILDYFNRASWDHHTGSIQDMKLTNINEVQQEDGVWSVLVDFLVRWSQTSRT